MVKSFSCRLKRNNSTTAGLRPGQKKEIEMGILLTITIIVAMAYLVGFMVGLILGAIWLLLGEGLNSIFSNLLFNQK